MQKVLSFLRLVPGFRSPGHPIRKIAAAIVYCFASLIILAGVFGSSPSNDETKQASSTSSPQVESATAQITGTPLPIQTPFNSKLLETKVTNVIDGDTFTIEGGRIVRMIGIDTPETVHPSKPVQCYGKEASDKTTELIEGQQVRLEKDVSETDRYKRLLRYVWKGEVLINELLVKEGYAQSSSYPPDIKYQNRFVTAQQEARDSQRGLWGSACAIPTSTPKSTPAASPKPVTAPPTPNTGSYICDCSKTCGQMSSCVEAQYQLNVCGCSRRDADGDGIACDAQCQ